MGDGLRLALTTFTVLRVRGPARIDGRTAGRAMGLAPPVGLLLALLADAVMVGFRLVEPDQVRPYLPAAVGITVLALLTRGLHLDGTADTVDGLASYRPPAEARAVMRSPEVGPLGVAAVVLLLLLQVTALASCVTSGRGTASLSTAVVAGRLAVTFACTRRTPAADRTGLGARVAGTVRVWVPLAWTVLAGAGAAAYEWFDEPSTRAADAVNAARPVVALVVALAVAHLVRRHCVRRLGGITGDVLGLLVEVTTTVALLVMAADLPLQVQDWTGVHQQVDH